MNEELEDVKTEVSETQPGVEAKLPDDDPVAALEDVRRQLAAATAERENLKRLNQELDVRRSDAERQSAQRQVQVEQFRQQAEQTTQTVADREFQMVESQITSQKDALSLLRRDYKSAMEAGDFDRAGEISEHLGRTSARLENLETSRSFLDDQRKNPPKPDTSQPRQDQNRPQQLDWNRSWSSGEFDQALRTLTPQTASWVRQHPQFGTDVQFRRQVQAAHNLASAKGYPQDTDGYFDFINKTVGIDQPELPRAAAPSQPSLGRTPGASAAAPPSRSVPGASTNPRHIQLTPEEREIAKLTLTADVIGKNPDGSPRDPEVVFAENKAKLLQEGEWDKWRRAV